MGLVISLEAGSAVRQVAAQFQSSLGSIIEMDISDERVAECLAVLKRCHLEPTLMRATE
ncbi:hypothetical protein D3C76_1806580 [compost metagenome]